MEQTADDDFSYISNEIEKRSKSLSNLFKIELNVSFPSEEQN
jgi:hypothetical protein